MGLAAAGSVGSAATLGCGADQVLAFVAGPYPASLLGPTDAATASCDSTNPAPSPAMRYFLASQIGCALDVDLTTGRNRSNGGEATDDGPRINAALSAAGASNPLTLLLDGPALISGLFLPAGGYWSIVGVGCGAGFFVKTGTNNDGIHNGGPRAAMPSDPGYLVPVPARGSTVTLTNFTLNGNRGDGTNGDATQGVPTGVPNADQGYYGINLMNLENVTITKVTVLNAPSYHVRFSNVGHATVSGCTMTSSGPNTDGVHVNGPANDITITGCSFSCGDDAIALNCPEGYGGDIRNVSVANCTFNGPTLMRLYNTIQAGYDYAIANVSVTGCTGTLRETAFLMGTYANDLKTVTLELACSNCQLTAPSLLDITTDFSMITLTNVTLTATTPGGGLVRTFYGTPRQYWGGELAIENCVVRRTDNYSIAAVTLVAQSTIGTLRLNGFSAQDPAGSTLPASPALVSLAPGSVGQLILDAVDPEHLAAPVTAGGFASLGSVSGAGVLATGWFFPDGVMANGVPYLSASTGRGAIKVNGVVQAYP